MWSLVFFGLDIIYVVKPLKLLSLSSTSSQLRTKAMFPIRKTNKTHFAIILSISIGKKLMELIKLCHVPVLQLLSI